MKRAVPAFALLLCACAELTGVADLSIGEKSGPFTPAPEDSGSPEQGVDSGPRVDSGGTKDGSTDPTPIDAGTDSPLVPCTALPTNETFPATPLAPWVLLGSAAAATPGVRLTPSAAGMLGALWWDASFMFERFEIAFSYVITTDAASTAYGPGDGLAFAWVSSATTPAIDTTKGGGGLAVHGLTGFAVAVDAYQNPDLSDPPTPNIAIKNTADMSTVAATAANMALIDGNAHTIRVRLASGSVTIALDGSEVLGPTALPGYTPYSGYFGFGAGTGGAFEDHEITSVTARIGSTGACAAP